MRFLYGIIALFLWTLFLQYLHSMGLKISDDVILISLSIITAGAMAGGGAFL
jgi:hypothetical protein